MAKSRSKLLSHLVGITKAIYRSAELLTKLSLTVAWIIFSLSLAYFTYALVQVANQLPAILQEVKEVRSTITGVTDQLPAILQEVKEVRSTVTGVVSEVQKTRRELPKLIADAEKLIDKSQGTIEDVPLTVVEGVLKTPFTAVGNIGKEIERGTAIKRIYGKAVWQKMIAVTDLLLKTPAKKQIKWKEEESKIEGKVTIVRAYPQRNEEGKLCYLMEYILLLEDGSFGSNQIDVCEASPQELAKGQLRYLNIPVVELNSFISF